MSLFNRYQREGRGVTKEEAAAQTPLKRFGAEFVHRFWQMIVLNLVYLLACIPIITIGPATAALNYVCRNFSQAKPVDYFTDFVEKCKEYFKRGFLIGLLQGLLAVLLVFSFLSWTSESFSLPSTGMRTVAVVVIFFVAYLLVCGSFYLYPMMVSFDLKPKQLIRNSVILAMTQLWRNLVMLALAAASVYVSLWFFPLTLPLPLFILFAFGAYVNNSLVYPVLEKYVATPNGSDESSESDGNAESAVASEE